MLNQIFKHAGKRVAHKAVEHHSRPGGLLDFRLGFALLRDRRVPVGSKLLALGIGIALTGTLVAIEAPLELLLGVFVPLLGIAADTVIDGLEIVLMPFVFACLVLPHVAPKQSVDAVRYS